MDLFRHFNRIRGLFIVITIFVALIVTALIILLSLCDDNLDLIYIPLPLLLFITFVLFQCLVVLALNSGFVLSSPVLVAGALVLPASLVVEILLNGGLFVDYLNSILLLVGGGTTAIFLAEV